ncbi:DUF292-domain-containing protein [Cenococcum geophilum 1.58]|uniref:DUF292-domain-containing protein n=1 Tax=Cenococcum geophilum 1.58 TaxID=794803 RepID=A0ACC8EMD5_9PEZI|nr:DUF292-domain-containing protein [Cenococcum geophilum 1.58]
MAPPSSIVSKLKVQLKLSISRLRMVQQKDSALAKQQRRAMAQLLEAGKVESARIRVENIIRSDITTELHEMLELYCELLLARSQLLDPPSSPYSSPNPHGIPPLDPALEEAVRSLIYAAPRTEVKELHAARALLIEKFGKDVALASMEGEGVAERVLSKLKIATPSPDLVAAYLAEIARFYGVPFGEDDDPASATTDNADDDGEEGGGNGGGGIGELAEPAKALEPPLEAATPPRLLGGPQSPLRITPPSPRTDNVAPKLRLPGATTAGTAGTGPANAASGGPGGKIPDVDELARRFAQLKR